MQAPNGNQRITAPSSRVRELGLVLPTPPTPLGAYVESSDAGNLLILQTSCNSLQIKNLQVIPYGNHNINTSDQHHILVHILARKYLSILHSQSEAL
jgi:hypothetical protein